MRALTRSLRRSLALTSAGALLLTVAPGVASAQTQPQARGTDNVCDTLGAYDRDRFDDTQGSAHERNVLCMADRDLTEGTRASGGQSYAPRAEVTRAQMASFIARFIRDYNAEFGGPELPPGEPNRFDDVAAPFVHTDNINALAGVQIVAGTNASGGDSYAPQASVTRGQTASLIRRTLSWLDDGNPNNASVPPPGPDVFPDVDPTFTHFANINAVAGVRIVQGFTDGNYRPQESVLRDQMASFVMRAYDYAVEQELGVDDDVVDPEFRTETFEVTMSWLNEVNDTGFGAGEFGAEGSATVTIDEETNTVTFDAEYADVTGPFGNAPGFHIHEGDIDENGPVVVLLATGAELNAGEGDLEDVTVDAGDFDVSEILDAPEDYYLNLHSDDFPAGAIRGQLPDGGQDLLPIERVDVDLSWFNEVTDTIGGNATQSGPLFGQGEVGATAQATLFLDTDNDLVSFSLDYDDVSGPFGGSLGFHLHEGEFDENGGVGFFLATGDQLDDGEGFITGTQIGAFDPDHPLGTEFSLAEVVAELDEYYLNLHSDDFAPGAVRGQLDGDIDLNQIDVAVDTISETNDTAAFTASGLDPEQEYRITLVPAANVEADGEFNASGVQFLNSVTPGDNPEATAADSNFPINALQPALLTVNDEDAAPQNPAAPRTQGAISPDAEGNITFSATIGPDDYHAFVYPEGGQSSFLEVVGENEGDVPEGVILEIHGFSVVVEGNAPVTP